MAQHDIDHVSGTTTTGHEWDGIKELNTPLPRWWLWVFYATIVWGFFYVLAYPAWPLINSYTTGFLGHSQRASALADHQAVLATRATFAQGMAGATVEEINADQTMQEFARANGRAAFGDNCAPCHGTGATGSRGYPSLQDDDWLWGGSLDEIYQTIRFGIRSDHPDTRVSDMPAFGKDQILEPQQIRDVAAYVVTLSGGTPSEGTNVAAGMQIFADNCAACHGDYGKGLKETGAPNLADGIWLYGGDEATIVETISNARRGVMPAWENKLDPVTIKSLAVFVHDLGGGT